MSPKAIAAPAVFETTLTAKDIMQRPVLAATPRASLRDVASQLVTNEFTGLPVAASDGRVLGVVSEADIIRILLEGKKLENLTASEAMTGPPITVDTGTPLEEVMKILEDHRILRVPVMSNNKLVGIISRSDVIRAILEPEFIAFGGL
jgi:tRNA nucleotidyltransferase (CCA-adding enzyme)